MNQEAVVSRIKKIAISSAKIFSAVSVIIASFFTSGFLENASSACAVTGNRHSCGFPLRGSAVYVKVGTIGKYFPDYDLVQSNGGISLLNLVLWLTFYTALCALAWWIARKINIFLKDLWIKIS